MLLPNEEEIAHTMHVTLVSTRLYINIYDVYNMLVF